MTQCYDAVPQHTATFGSSPSPRAPFAPQPRSPGSLSRLPTPRTAPGCSPSAGGAAAGRTDGALGTRFQGEGRRTGGAERKGLRGETLPSRSGWPRKRSLGLSPPVHHHSSIQPLTRAQPPSPHPTCNFPKPDPPPFPLSAGSGSLRTLPQVSRSASHPPLVPYVIFWVGKRGPTLWGSGTGPPQCVSPLSTSEEGA